MRKGQTRIGWLVITLLLLFALVLTACTIRKIDDNADKKSDMYATWEKTGTGFDSVKYVDANWESKIIPAFINDSTEISLVLKGLTADLNSTIKKYGYRKEEDSVETFFKVKGLGRVLTYNDSSRIGLLEIDLEPADGTVDVFIQVGPVLKRTEIRDSLSFIKFTDVGNQLQFASLSDELNKRVLDYTLKEINLPEVVGKTIEFYGVFSIDSENIDMEKIIITPVIVKNVN